MLAEHVDERSLILADVVDPHPVETDVDQYVTELRKALMAQIHQGTKVIV